MSEPLTGTKYEDPCGEESSEEPEPTRKKVVPVPKIKQKVIDNGYRVVEESEEEEAEADYSPINKKVKAKKKGHHRLDAAKPKQTNTL